MGIHHLVPVKSLAAGDCAADDVIERARANLHVRIGHTRARIDVTPAPEPDALTDRELRRDLNAAENAELPRLYDDGTINQATRQQLQHNLDLEAARLSEQRQGAESRAGRAAETPAGQTDVFSRAHVVAGMRVHGSSGPTARSVR